MAGGRLTPVAVLVAMVLGGALASAASAGSPAEISFVRGGDRGPTTVWLANSDGGDPRQLAVGDEALMSPDGAFVTVQNYTSKGAALRLYATSGKLLGGFFTAGKQSASALAWSPDSRYVAVSVLTTAATGKGSLYLIDTRTLRARLVTDGVVAGASFDPAGHRLVFGMATSEATAAPVNLYTTVVSGGSATQLTTDGHSFDPVWAGGHGIVFDRSQSRGTSRAPIFQLWLEESGRFTQLTHLKIPNLLDGLSPIAADADGNRLLAEYTGEDTSDAWTVQLSPLRVQELKVNGQPVQGGAISSDGRRLLIDVGGFEQSPNFGEVESVAFGGGVTHRLTRGAEPSWSG